VRSEIPLSYSPLLERGDRGDFPLYQRGLPAVRQGACSEKGKASFLSRLKRRGATTNPPFLPPFSKGE